MYNMEKNNQPLILGIVVIGAVLIIALALIFTRSDSETEAPAEGTISENEENEAGEDENGEDGQQPDPQPDPVPLPDPQPRPDPTPPPQPIPEPQPDPTPDPQPQPGVLPPNWHSLTSQEKNELNPFDCDHETQWVSAEDGSCIDKQVIPQANLVGTELLLELGFERCDSSAYSLETYLMEISERHDITITEVREQTDVAGLPVVLSHECFYSGNAQSDTIEVLVIEENVVSQVYDFAGTHNYYNLLFDLPLPLPLGYDYQAERISHAGYRYVGDDAEVDCFSPTPTLSSPSLLLLRQLFDDRGYDDYEQHPGGCHY